MIYAYRPKRRNRIAHVLSVGLLLCFLTLTVSAAFAGAYRYFLEFAALIALAVSVTVAGRYLLKEYIYSVEEGPVGPDLTVVEWQGKKRRTVTRIALSEIREVIRETPDTRSALKARARGARHFDYCVDLGCTDAVYLFLTENGKETVIRFSPDKTMEALLLSHTENGETGEA